MVGEQPGDDDETGGERSTKQTASETRGERERRASNERAGPGSVERRSRRVREAGPRATMSRDSFRGRSVFEAGPLAVAFWRVRTTGEGRRRKRKGEGRGEASWRESTRAPL